MSKTDNHQEHQTPNGVYVIEKRVDYSYDLVKLMMKTHSKESMK